MKTTDWCTRVSVDGHTNRCLPVCVHTRTIKLTWLLTPSHRSLFIIYGTMGEQKNSSAVNFHKKQKVCFALDQSTKLTPSVATVSHEILTTGTKGSSHSLTREAGLRVVCFITYNRSLHIGLLSFPCSVLPHSLAPDPSYYSCEWSVSPPANSSANGLVGSRNITPWAKGNTRLVLEGKRQGCKKGVLDVVMSSPPLWVCKLKPNQWCDKNQEKPGQFVDLDWLQAVRIRGPKESC